MKINWNKVFDTAMIMFGLLALLVFLTLTSCQGRVYANIEEDNKMEDEHVEASNVINVTATTRLYIKEIHGCEYVMYKTMSGAGITHHAACNNINHYE